jgi:hypothetical protein
MLGGTGHCSQLSLRKIAYQRHQRLTVKDMSRAAVATDRRGVNYGSFPPLADMTCRVAKCASSLLAS